MIINTVKKLLYVGFIVACITIVEFGAIASPDPKEVKFIEHSNCLYGCPLGADPDNFLVDHEIFLLSSNRETKFADWAAYLVKAENLSGDPRPRNWASDPLIPDKYTLKPSDYQGAYAAFQYDRGYQVPLANFRNHPDWSRINYISNITPQRASLNRGAFAALSKKERILAGQNDVVYIITGTVYVDDMPVLPNAHLPHRVPSGYWKIIAVKDENKRIKMASFLFSQTALRTNDYCKYSASLDEIEKLTGFEFFSDYPYPEYLSLLSELGC
ncbi:MAG: DNA/RNA non-specific endonuclease [Gammaproteobacteria bacterium]